MFCNLCDEGLGNNDTAKKHMVYIHKNELISILAENADGNAATKCEDCDFETSICERLEKVDI